MSEDNELRVSMFELQPMHQKHLGRKYEYWCTECVNQLNVEHKAKDAEIASLKEQLAEAEEDTTIVFKDKVSESIAKHSLEDHNKKLQAENSKLKELLKAKEDLVSHEGCLAENSALRKELDEYKEIADNCCSPTMDELTKAEARVKALEDGLRKHGKHTEYCMASCHCGLDTLLNQSEEQ